MVNTFRSTAWQRWWYHSRCQHWLARRTYFSEAAGPTHVQRHTAQRRRPGSRWIRAPLATATPVAI